MKLKLDLHPIYSDSRQIEQSLNAIIDEAIEKRATEVEIIPGKGSGALKKSVLRFLDRPDIKAKYHRIDKDSDNFGRLFVYFKHEAVEHRAAKSSNEIFEFRCFCCNILNRGEVEEAPKFPNKLDILTVCASCESPNIVTVTRISTGLRTESASGY